MPKRSIDADDGAGEEAGKRSKCDDGDGADGPSVNRYAGWTVPTDGYRLPTVDAADLTPEAFYEGYIQRRRPVVIRGSLPDVSSIAKWKEFDYLDSKVGEQSIMVERRASASDSFGRGNEVKMTCRELMQLLKDGDDKHYLTPQDVQADADGRPELMSPLMAALKGDFPLRPSLMGNLVPQNINMWMGNNNRDGASSGLHHDYHDNLYMVLKGRKRFRLYSPKDTEKMYTRGELLKVHPNGRINYKGEETTAYGADLQSDAAAHASRRKDAAEKMLEEAERAVEEGKPGAQEQLEKAEEELESAMDAVLDAEMGGDEEEEDASACDELFGGGPRTVDKTVKNPDNFSGVPVDILDDEEKLKEAFPKMLEANAAFCEIEAGSMLYLPASWFHEVTSFAAANAEGGGSSSGHLAMNYWFHPPDGSRFDAPYSTDFWQNDYCDRFAGKKCADSPKEFMLCNATVPNTLHNLLD